MGEQKIEVPHDVCRDHRAAFGTLDPHGRIQLAFSIADDAPKLGDPARLEDIQVDGDFPLIGFFPNFHATKFRVDFRILHPGDAQFCLSRGKLEMNGSGTQCDGTTPLIALRVRFHRIETIVQIYLVLGFGPA